MEVALTSKRIRMPSEDVVPPGAHRELLKELFHKYGLAGRPCLRRIVDETRAIDLAGTASQETIRLVMNGDRLPRQWGTMYAVYAPLCLLAHVDPEAPYNFQLVDETAEKHPELETWRATHKELVQYLWNCAVDSEVPVYVTHRTLSKPRAEPDSSAAVAMAS
jgi:hypothetical protein